MFTVIDNIINLCEDNNVILNAVSTDGDSMYLKKLGMEVLNEIITRTKTNIKRYDLSD